MSMCEEERACTCPCLLWGATFAVGAAAPGDNVRRVHSMETKASRWICRTRANLDETRATTLYSRL